MLDVIIEMMSNNKQVVNNLPEGGGTLGPLMSEVPMKMCPLLMTLNY